MVHFDISTLGVISILGMVLWLSVQARSKALLGMWGIGSVSWIVHESGTISSPDMQMILILIVVGTALLAIVK